MDWDSLSKLKNLTFDIVKKYKNKPWNWSYLSYNNFDYEKPISYSLENQNKCKMNLLVYEEELMKFAWHPDRFIKWCWDDDEKREFGFN